jgi:hypothetical protein
MKTSAKSSFVKIDAPGLGANGCNAIQLERIPANPSSERDYVLQTPVNRAMTIFCTSLVPSPISRIFESR